MANSPCIGVRSDYESDLLTDFGSDMFGSTSSKIKNKSDSVAKRTQRFFLNIILLAQTQNLRLTTPCDRHS